MQPNKLYSRALTVEPQKILIIDDDQTMLDTLSGWFRIQGHQVICSTAANEALWYGRWQWQDFDCNLTGINQPGLNGLLFTLLVRLNHGPPVIVMSGYKPAMVRALAFRAGATAFLEKPIDLQELKQLVYVCCE